MATVKLTVARGRPQFRDVIQAAGVAEAQSDTLSVNIDFTRWRQGDAVLALEAIIQAIERGRFLPQ